MSAEYVLVFGANIYEALQPGINTYGAIVGHRSSKGTVKFTIVDPRATNASAHAENWIPIKPCQDWAFAMGMIRWMIENERLNVEFLTAPNQKAADKRGHACHTNASHLVIVDEEHKNTRKFLRISDLDPSSPEAEGKAYVVLAKDGKPQAFDKVRKSLQVCRRIADRQGGQRVHIARHQGGRDPVSRRRQLSQRHLCSLCGGDAQCHGRECRPQRGIHERGRRRRLLERRSVRSERVPRQEKAAGVLISREKAAYEKTAEFKKKGYPSQRPWFPFSRGGLSVETLSGIDQQYPYPCKILFTYFFNPVYSIPGGYRYKETLKSTDKVPLHVSIDIAINESNIYADYIVPDISYSEGHYGFLTPHAPALKFTGVRTPTIEPLTGRTTDGRPFGEETFLIDLARAAGLPGFGENALTGKDGKAG